MINKISSSAVKFFDTSYIFRFILRLGGLYLLFRLINWAMIGAITPEGNYSYFIDHYLNYVTAIKVSILEVGTWIGHLCGVPSHLIDTSTIQIESATPLTGGGQLFMAWSCVGLEVFSFWAAFALADSTPMKKKLLWLFGGLSAIFLINAMRVAILLIAITNNWTEIGALRHHDTFNIVAYGLIFLMMFIYYKKNKKELGN
jgi:exosortase/archaeosortase family protein